MTKAPEEEENAAQAQAPARRRQVRFDFEGNVIAPDADVSTSLGLHHHAEQQSQAGYTLAGEKKDSVRDWGGERTAGGCRGWCTAFLFYV